MLPGMELMACPNLAVPREVMHHVVRVESSSNPYAIGVVGGRLARQPRNLPEALSTARMLEERGYNFSLGLAQVNRYNLVKYGLHSYEKAFQPCANLVAGSQILRECYGRSGGDWGKSFSCYYSGDFRTGYRHGYVQKVFASMRGGADPQVTAVAPIQVIDRAARRVGVSSLAADAARDEGNQGSLAARRGARAAPSPASVSETIVEPSSFQQPAQLQPVTVANATSGPVMVGMAVPTASAHPPFKLSPGQPQAVTATAASPVAVTGDTAFVF